MTAKKHDPEFMAILKENAILDEATGVLNFKNFYASICINFGWKGSVISIPYAHVVWFLTHGRWPLPNKVIDHIDDNAMNNASNNHQELTHEENQAKRRGRIIYRNYGTGKYGYGLDIRQDPRDGRCYITRRLSRGQGDGDGKNIKKGLGGFANLAEAEAKIAEYAAEIEANGIDHMPEYDGRDQRKISASLKEQTPYIRQLRTEGYTLHQICEMTGFSTNTIYGKVKDIMVDKQIRSEKRAASGANANMKGKVARHA